MIFKSHHVTSRPSCSLSFCPVPLLAQHCVHIVQCCQAYSARSKLLCLQFSLVLSLAGLPIFAMRQSPPTPQLMSPHLFATTTLEGLVACPSPVPLGMPLVHAHTHHTLCCGCVSCTPHPLSGRRWQRLSQWWRRPWTQSGKKRRGKYLPQ